MSASGRIVVLVTAPGAEAASRIGRVLVDEGLCACANVVGPVRSIYRWQGAIHDEAEALLLIKTRAELFDRVAARIRELHSYDVPEVIALPITAGSEPYLRWIDDSTAGG
jgi:periplasmic divalent cation tolerance protein